MSEAPKQEPVRFVLPSEEGLTSKNNKLSGVYAVAFEDGTVKFGRSFDLKERIWRHFHRKESLIGMYVLTEPGLGERLLLVQARLLAGNPVSGRETFKGTPQTALAVLSEVAKGLDNPAATPEPSLTEVLRELRALKKDVKNLLSLSVQS